MSRTPSRKIQENSRNIQEIFNKYSIFEDKLKSRRSLKTFANDKDPLLESLLHYFFVV